MTATILRRVRRRGVMTDHLVRQGVLQPGTPGYWQVWGARAYDIQPGDLVAAKYDDTGYFEFEVAATAPRGDLMDSIRPRFLGGDGKHYHIGALQPCVVLRKGTHHTLAGSVR